MKKAIFLLSMIALTVGLSAQDNRTRAPRTIQEKSTETREAVKKNQSNDNQKPATVTRPATPTPVRTRTVTNPAVSKPEASPSRSVQTAPSNNSRAVQREPVPNRDNSSTRTRTSPPNQNPSGNTERTRSVGPNSGNVPNQGSRTTTNKSTNNRSATVNPVENDSKSRSRESNSGSAVNQSRTNNNSISTPASRGSDTPERVRTSSPRTVNQGVNQGRASDNRREATTTKGNTSQSRKVGVSGTNNSRSNHYDPKVGQTYSEQRRVYVTPAPRRIVRPTPVIQYVYRPVEYRRIHHPYIAPARVNIYWSNNMHREYVYLYPEYNLWYYPYGYRIETVSAYDASAFIGEVANIFGRVYETWHLRDTDEYYLYFGGPYPYHDFSLVLKGKDARRFSRNPERFFENRNVTVTGLVSLWEGKPEIVVKKRNQIEIY